MRRARPKEVILAILKTLYLRGEALTSKSIGKLSGYDPRTVKKYCDVLKALGIVKSETHAVGTQGRTHTYYGLTRTGKKLASRVVEVGLPELSEEEIERIADEMESLVE